MMTTPQRRVLELALIGLEAEKHRIEQELMELQRRLRTNESATRSQTHVAVATNTQRVAHNRGKKMSSTQKRKISQAMKARWAKLRSGKTH